MQEIVTPTEDLESRWPGRSCRCQNNKLKSCRFVKIRNGLSLLQIVAFFCKFLSAVGVLEQDCHYIFCKFRAMFLVAKTLGRPHLCYLTNLKDKKAPQTSLFPIKILSLLNVQAQ